MKKKMIAWALTLVMTVSALSAAAIPASAATIEKTNFPTSGITSIFRLFDQNTSGNNGLLNMLPGSLFLEDSGIGEFRSLYSDMFALFKDTMSMYRVMSDYMKYFSPDANGDGSHMDDAFEGLMVNLFGLPSRNGGK